MKMRSAPWLLGVALLACDGDGGAGPMDAGAGQRDAGPGADAEIPAPPGPAWQPGLALRDGELHSDVEVAGHAVLLSVRPGSADEVVRFDRLAADGADLFVRRGEDKVGTRFDVAAFAKDVLAALAEGPIALDGRAEIF